MRNLTILIAVGLLAGQASAAVYTNNFDTEGSAADFAAFHTNGDASFAFSEQSGGPSGDFLRVSLTRTGTGTAQLRHWVAASNASSAIVPKPTTATDIVTLSVDIVGVNGAGLPDATQLPFTALGLAGRTDTQTFAGEKLMVQVNNTGNQITINRHAVTNKSDGGAGTTFFTHTLATSLYAGILDADENTGFVPFSLQLEATGTHARILLNGVALADNSGGANDGNTWSPHTNLFTAMNFTAANVVPFVGVIRGATNVDVGNTITSEFDNFVLAVPEPASLGLLGLAAAAMLARRRR